MMFRKFFLALAALAALGLAAPPARAAKPATYYNAANTLNAATLRSSLNDIVSNKTSVVSFSNNSASFAAIEAINIGDDSSKVVIIYGADDQRDASLHSGDSNVLTGGWSREHVFPQSCYGSASPMVDDLNALLPADFDINSVERGNGYYDVLSSGFSTDAYGNKYNSTAFEPFADKGEVARTDMYMDIRYEGHTVNNISEADLTLTDTGIVGNGNGNMRQLSTLISWSDGNAPGAYEIARNARVYDYQGNVNPFVDHPEYVDIVYNVGTQTIHDGDSITVGSLNRAPVTCTPGAPDLPILTITVTPGSNEWDIGGFAFVNTSAPSGGGAATDAEMGTVKVWLDADEDGLPNNIDPVLASGTFSGGTATITCGTPFRLLASNSPALRSLLVTVTTADNASDGKNVSLAPTSITHSATGGADNDLPISGIGSADYAIVAGTVKIINFSTIDSFGTGYEYITLANQTGSSINLNNWSLKRRGTNNSTLTLTGAIPAFGHYVIASGAYTSTVNGVAINQFGGANGVPTSGSAEATGYSLTLANASAVQIDGFSVNGGGDTSSLWEGTAFNGGNDSATTTYARKRAHSGSGPYVDTENNAYDEYLLTGASSKIPPSDSLVPVELSGFSVE